MGRTACRFAPPGRNQTAIARQRIAASALPRVGPGRDVLLVNGLTGKEAVWAATGLLHEAVCPDVVVPASGEATGP
ncbi:hypothetical protein [Streptomyces sp. LaPpAH-108]|uniref:hypothetical protein n=1 Tax=Streptomyces sp. LaPpAH-108 TaxID=1155714 RepID=UPI00037DF84C|nr:hypothetical protein [Streptomyces sp. LaPpAH-108]